MFKIIIVEDDNEIREELKILLQNSGYEVNLITDFENVHNQILEENAHLVFFGKSIKSRKNSKILWE